MNKEKFSELERFVTKLKNQRKVKIEGSFLSKRIQRQLQAMEEDANLMVIERIINGVPPPHKRKNDKSMSKLQNRQIHIKG